MNRLRFYIQVLVIFFVVIALLPFCECAAAGEIVWVSSCGSRPLSIDSDSDYLYMAGYGGSGDKRWIMSKMQKSDGTLVWKQESDPTTDYDVANGITSDETYIYVVGYERHPVLDYYWRIEKRAKHDGSIVWTQVINPTGSNDQAYAVAIDDQHLFIAGADQAGGDYRMRVEKRRKSDGGLVWTQVNNPSGSFDIFFSVAVDDTYIYLGGYDSVPGNAQWHLEKRLKSDGSQVWTQVSDPGGFDMIESLVIDDNYIYAVGPGGWRVEKRRKSDGGLEWVQYGAEGSLYQRALYVAESGDYIYISGEESPGLPIMREWYIEKRSKSDGSLEWVQITSSTNWDTADTVTADDSYVYIAGYPGGRTEKRTQSATSSDIDIGLRIYDGTAIVPIASEPAGTVTSPLRIHRTGTTYGIILVDTSDACASGIRVQTSSGAKALKKFGC